jgi:hypothetical protein
MSRRFVEFMSSGLRARHVGVRGGILVAIAIAAIASPQAHGQVIDREILAQAALQSEETRMLARTFRAHPGDVFVKFAKASHGKGADRARRAAADLGRILGAQAAAGDEQRDDVAALLEKGVRGGFAQGLSMAQLLDVLTAVDPMGGLMDAEVRTALWREIARRPSSRMRHESPNVPGRDEGARAGGVDA